MVYYNTSNVGSYSTTPVVTAGSYATGNVMGGLITLGSSGSVLTGGVIQSVTASFLSGVVPALDVVFLKGIPTNSTITDHAAFVLNPLDRGLVLGVAHLADNTLLGASAPSLVQSTSSFIAFGGLTGGILYAVVVCRTGSITLTAVNDLILSVQVKQ